MERSRLKNIIILILLLLNACLAGILLVRAAEAQRSRKYTAQELTQLFASSDVSLELDQIPSDTPPSARVLVRDASADQGIADFLLGGSAQETDEGGGLLSFSSQTGQGVFRANGVFTVSGHLSEEDPQDLCRKFCRLFGYRELTFSLENGSGTAAAVQYYEGYPVSNATVEFRIEDHCLVSVNGYHLPDTYSAQETGDTAVLTAATALTRLLEARSGGTVFSAVQGLSLCYELQSSTAVPMSLSPSWDIATDTGVYSVNCLTGAVSRR